MLTTGFTIEEALPFFTVNAAKGLNLNKGQIELNKDADLILIDENNDIEDVLIKGVLHVQNKQLLIKGTYE